MRRVLICAAVVAATWAAPLGLRTPLAQTTAVAAPTSVARVIVKFRPDSPLLRKQALSMASQQMLQADALGRRIGVPLQAGRALSDRWHVVTATGVDSQALALRIAAEGDVEYAVPDGRKRIVAAAPNDLLYAAGTAILGTSGGPVVGQWYLKPPGPAGTAANTAPAAINAEQAWDITTGSSTIVVADIDTGIRFDHPDLKTVANGGNVLPGYDMISDDRTSGDSTIGRDTDASDSGDFVSQADVNAGAPGCSQADVGSTSSWHGTQTAGLIAAQTNNSQGIASVGRNVMLLPVRALGKCGGTDSDIVAAMLWAGGIAVPNVPINTTPAKVVNLSLGSSGACGPLFQDAVSQLVSRGVSVVVAAGNSTGHLVGEPANCPGAIAVAGLRHVGTKVGFSDLGSEIAISAPGGNCVTTSGICQYTIMSTSNAGATTPAAASYTDAFKTTIGTSFSAPLVSGAAALLLSVRPSMTPAEIKSALQTTARKFPDPVSGDGIATCSQPTATSPDQLECHCTTSTCGAGMLDVRAAVLSVSGVQASISLTTTTPTANQDVALTSNSVLSPGQSIAKFAWTILNAGTSRATITGANDGSAVVVRPTAAGVFVIQLTTTDNTGFVSTTTLSVTVVGPMVTPASTPPAASTGGGGALGVGWLLLLLVAVLSLALTSARGRAARAVLSVAARGARRD